ncbi:MAG: DctP family TRAP transporter solute-binding subunit [Synergistaceae bacterium]|jgi:tripartite ATP-independent transporter DctP family solute receptor|nr:DctP family TRAP transporter solute-binding subunit [Synergistaceae bacterium]
MKAMQAVKTAKKAILWALAAMVILSAVPALAEDYTIRLAFIGAESHGSYIALNEKFKKDIEEKTGGRVKVELYPNAQLGSDRQAIEGISIGTLEMAVVGGSSLLTLDDRMTIMDLPFIFKTREAAHKVYDEFLTEEFNKYLEPHDILILFSGELGYRHITNSRGPIQTPADLKGLKIRTMENPLHVQTFNLLGANPTPVAFSELYTALQQGTVDAEENPIGVIVTSKLYEVQKYTSLTGHIYTTAPFIISKSYWEGLPEDIRKIISEVAEETKPYQRDVIENQNSEFLEELEKAGVTVNDLSPDDKQAFIDLCKPVYDAYTTKHGESLIQKIMSAQ